MAAILNFGNHLEKWGKFAILAHFASKPLQYIYFLKGNRKWKCTGTFSDMATILNFGRHLEKWEKFAILAHFASKPLQDPNLYIPIDAEFYWDGS